jgi:hypothetical protein
MRINANYTNNTWIAFDHGPADVSDTPPPGSIQFTISEVEEPLLD